MTINKHTLSDFSIGKFYFVQLFYAVRTRIQFPPAPKDYLSMLASREEDKYCPITFARPFLVISSFVASHSLT
jgi:hypothetical protein